jgi:hypothetical protein
MLMTDRITSITADGGAHGLGQVVAELDIQAGPLVLQVPFRV